MTDKQQTAVAWLFNRLSEYYPLKQKKYKSIIEKALEIERQQLIDFGNDCIELFHTDWDASTTVGEQMYKQKFEKP